MASMAKKFSVIQIKQWKHNSTLWTSQSKEMFFGYSKTFHISRISVYNMEAYVLIKLLFQNIF